MGPIPCIRHRRMRHTRAMTAIEDTLPPVADDAPTELIDATVAEVAEMNGDGWAVFEENGVTDSTAVQLEFAFSAPNEHTAEDLAEYLQVTADYEASPGAPATESDEWTVTGTTPAVTASRAAASSRAGPRSSTEPPPFPDPVRRPALRRT